ncbi:MAG: hypothetical protein ACK5LR_03520 [Mangrovibacterium sp.]
MDNLKCKFDEADQIFSFLWEGKMTGQDIIDSALLGVIPEGCKRVICNHVNADIVGMPSDFRKVGSFFQENMGLFDSCRFAAVIETPAAAAAYSLIINMVHHRNYRLFSTEEAAKKWLKELPI